MQLIAGQRYRHMITGDVCMIETVDFGQNRVKVRYEKTNTRVIVPIDVMYEFFELAND